ncbi:hypothetical protein HRbin19_01309 [bacterium HR19]|nr:hypothetical protein HRbin19_01309 [bacterium HR19]
MFKTAGICFNRVFEERMNQKYEIIKGRRISARVRLIPLEVNGEKEKLISEEVISPFFGQESIKHILCEAFMVEF